MLFIAVLHCNNDDIDGITIRGLPQTLSKAVQIAKVQLNNFNLECSYLTQNAFC